VGRHWTVLCAGDTFISPELLVEALLPQVGEDSEFLLHRSAWPYDPMRTSDDVFESVGDADEVAELAVRAEIVVTHAAPIGKLLFDKAPRLELVGCCRGGPVNVNLKAAAARGIPVVTSPGRNAQATAEFTVGLLLAGLRRIVDGSESMKAGNWDGGLYSYAQAGTEIGESTVGVIGFGRVGRRVATILRSFGCRVLVSDPFATLEEIRTAGGSPATIDELLTRSDIVTLHARLGAETYHLIGSHALGRMKKNAYLVNTARGGLLDYDALVTHVQDGHLSGAALDVFPEEPLPATHPLWRLPQITMTPHIAGATKACAVRAAEEVATKVGQYCRGEASINAIGGQNAARSEPRPLSGAM
jgi:D-3-phosphoglycerate dehydrogenase